jgi:hypothetical protein
MMNSLASVRPPKLKYKKPYILPEHIILINPKFRLQPFVIGAEWMNYREELVGALTKDKKALNNEIYSMQFLLLH